MTTKALDTWVNAKPEDRTFAFIWLAIGADDVLNSTNPTIDFGFSPSENRRCSEVVKAARTVLKQIANGELIVTSFTKNGWLVQAQEKKSKTSKKGAKK